MLKGNIVKSYTINICMIINFRRIVGKELPVKESTKNEDALCSHTYIYVV